MKNLSLFKLFLVHKHSAVVVETSLNDFKPNTGLHNCITHKKTRTFMKSAGIKFSMETIYNFPKGKLMYIGFPTQSSAQKHIRAKQMALNTQLEEDKISASKFIARWKNDMQHEGYVFL